MRGRRDSRTSLIWISANGNLSPPLSSTFFAFLYFCVSPSLSRSAVDGPARCVISNIGLRACPWPRIGWRNDRGDEGYRARFVRSAHSFVRSSSTLAFAAHVAARAFAKSVRVNGRSEIEATVPLWSLSLSLSSSSIPSGYSAVLYRSSTYHRSTSASDTPVHLYASLSLSLPCVQNFRTMH